MAPARRVLTSAVIASAAIRATCQGGLEKKTREDGRVVQEMKIEAPVFTEEDQYGYNMPDMYKCDSCKAVMFHLDDGLRKRQPKSRRLKQWEYTDYLEEACKSSFEGYGVKLVNGQNKLSGPGIVDNELQPGMGAIQMGGETWTKRLSEECKKIVFEKIGEEDIYDAFYKRVHTVASEGVETAPKLGEALHDICFKELRHCKAGPDAAARPKPRPDGAKKEAKKAEKKEKKEAEKKAKKEAEEKKKEQKKKKDAQPKQEAAADSSTGDKVDVQAFLRKLAVQHGLTSDEYVAARSEKDWEKLVLSMASKIFNKQNEEM
eukprot:TRINITY_DN7730_c0_g1_i1.p1 TRINITY_DN7730_c0_g1~~TRINITY_DN7730_c0_g1_i1.p1  ORF type:complete len:344 (-),score=121.08 TRINITY_DN7730_c0_g1_i1:315-1268(-)